MTKPKAVVVVSGGLDSVTALHLTKSAGYDCTVISFNYGQRHKRELEYAQYWGETLGEAFHLVNLENITTLISNSALTNPDIEVPEGHYALETMKSTVVPNRNAIMLAIATGLAVNIGATQVVTGVHAGDHAVYPDCRPEFITAMSRAMYLGNEGFGNLGLASVQAPFVNLTKAQIVAKGAELGVDFTKTWSCYKGGDNFPCGRCSTDLERIEAFVLAGVTDPTEYQDMEYVSRVVEAIKSEGKLPENVETL